MIENHFYRAHGPQPQASTSMEDIIQQVPIELWPQIFSYLEAVPFARCQSVCKTWNAQFNDSLWHECFKHHFYMMVEDKASDYNVSEKYLVPNCFATWQDCVKTLFGARRSKLQITPNQNDVIKASALSVIPLIRTEDIAYSLYLNNMNVILYQDNFGPMFGLPAPTSCTATGQISKNSLSFLNWEAGATPIYYMYADGNWKWSPDGSSWMSVQTTTVEAGLWAGHQPVPGNIKLIETLRACQPVLIIRSIDASLPSFAIINSVVGPKLDHLVFTEEYIGANNIKMVRAWLNIATKPHVKMQWLFKAK